jgi:Uma2 family endonuclease
MTTLAELGTGRIRTIVFLPSGRKDCLAVARATFEEYLALDIEGLTEWVDGEVRLYMSVSRQHQLLVNFLARLIGLFLESHPLGELQTAPYAIRASATGPGREPDLMFVLNQNRERLRDSHLAGPPDLAIEVVSPDSVERDYVEKFREYEAAGVLEYWIIDSRPGQQRVDFFVLRKGRFEPVHPEDGVYRSTVVDGFWLKVDWLWEPEPRASVALREILG